MSFTSDLMRKAEDIKTAAVALQKQRQEHSMPPPQPVPGGGPAYQSANAPVDGAFDFVPSVFVPHAHDPLPSLTAMRNSIASIGELPTSEPKNRGSVIVNQDASHALSSLAGSFGQWNSVTGNEFKTNFLARFEGAVDNQRAFVKELIVSLDCMISIIKTVQEQTDKIANDTLKALNGGGGSSATNLGAAFASGLLLVVGTALTGGTMVPALVGGLASVGGAVFGNPARPNISTDIYGGDGFAIVASMVKALDNLRTTSHGHTQAVTDALRADVSRINECLSRSPRVSGEGPVSTDLLPMRPSIANGYDYSRLDD